MAAPGASADARGDVALGLAPPRSGAHVSTRDGTPGMAAHWKHMEKRREVPTKEVRMVRRQQHQIAVILLPHVEKS